MQNFRFGAADGRRPLSTNLYESTPSIVDRALYSGAKLVKWTAKVLRLILLNYFLHKMNLNEIYFFRDHHKKISAKRTFFHRRHSSALSSDRTILIRVCFEFNNNQNRRNSVNCQSEFRSIFLTELRRTIVAR